MNRFALIITFCITATAQQTMDIVQYCQALAGELAACQNTLAVSEAQQKDFVMRSQDRERSLSVENAKLQAEIQRLLKQKQDLLAEKKRLETEKQQLAQSHQACIPAIAAMEQALEAKRDQLPKPLQETMLPPLEGDNLAARLHRCIESQDSIHNFIEQPPKPLPTILTGPDGVQREFQLLPLGLSVAYAVAPEAKLAGFGIFHDGDWTWQWKQEWFPAMKKAFDICAGKCPPTLLPLPLQHVNQAGGGK